MVRNLQRALLRSDGETDNHISGARHVGQVNYADLIPKHSHLRFQQKKGNGVMRVRCAYGACTVRVRQRTAVASSMAQSFTIAVAEHTDSPWCSLLIVPMRGAQTRLAQLLH